MESVDLKAEQEERKHCLGVSEDWLGSGLDPQKFSRPSLAQLIARERAAAREEACAAWAAVFGEDFEAMCEMYVDYPIEGLAPDAIKLREQLLSIRRLKESRHG